MWRPAANSKRKAPLVMMGWMSYTNCVVRSPIGEPKTLWQVNGVTVWKLHAEPAPVPPAPAPTISSSHEFARQSIEASVSNAVAELPYCAISGFDDVPCVTTFETVIRISGFTLNASEVE